MDGQTTVTVTDLLGTGTACLVWSSTAPGDAARPVRYVDLTGGAKPYLLNTTRNNLGAETRLTYAPSTRFFLADRAAGRPWATRLPFPVHVVERVEVVDHVSRSRFVSRYAYHHGHFDGYEREFRGFGMVEQFDTEAFDAEQVHSAPPVLTRTWYHTGAYLGHHRIAMRFADEYHREPGTRVTDLADTVLPANLTADEEREACRALAGTVLRREVYALDGTDRQARPYTVSEQRYAVRLRQPRRGTAHAGFAVHPCESVQEHHERTRYQVAGAQVADPRISHTAVLDVDDFGNVLRSVAVAYGRAHPDPALPAAVRAEQGRVRITMSEQRYTNAVTAGAAYRTPVVAETRAYEILGVTASPAALFTVDGIGAFADAAGDGAHDVPAEDLDADPTGAPHRRLLSHTRVRYRRDDLNGPLPLGVVESLALPYTSQQLALTAGMVAAVHGAQVTDQMLTGAGYVHDADPHWWIPSGQVSFTAEPAAPAEEHEQARRHFFQPRRFTDAFGHPTTVAYDAHDLFPVEIQDPLGNRTTAGHDYRVLQPRLVTDANRNRVAAAFDTLGMVVGTAVLGKPGQEPGDSLDGFTADLTDAEIAADLADPLGTAQALLGAATTRVVYDIFAYWRSRDTDTPQGPVAHAMAREVHVGDLAPGQSSRIQHELVYSDGLGRPMQNKARVAAGPLTPDGPAVPVRWTGTGWTIRDNKGQPVRGYEPFFTATHRLEFARTAGVSSVACRDPLGRVVATLAPDHTWVKATFDPWRQESWDSNDTVLLDPATDTDVAGFTGRLDPDEYLPTWYDRRAGGALGPLEQAAAAKAASHAATPAVTHLDSLGRPVATIAHNRTADGVDERLTSLVEPDIAGRTRRVTDPLGRLVARYDHDLLGRRLAHDLMDAGRLRIVLDIAGQPCHTFDSRGQQHGVDYDALRRPPRRCSAQTVDSRSPSAGWSTARPCPTPRPATCGARSTRSSTAPASTLSSAATSKATCSPRAAASPLITVAPRTGPARSRWRPKPSPPAPATTRSAGRRRRSRRTTPAGRIPGPTSSSPDTTTADCWTGSTYGPAGRCQRRRACSRPTPPTCTPSPVSRSTPRGSAGEWSTATGCAPATSTTRTPSGCAASSPPGARQRCRTCATPTTRRATSRRSATRRSRPSSSATRSSSRRPGTRTTRCTGSSRPPGANTWPAHPHPQAPPTRPASGWPTLATGPRWPATPSATPTTRSATSSSWCTSRRARVPAGPGGSPTTAPATGSPARGSATVRPSRTATTRTAT
ncbi:toxin TcdB middle/N-terminal domain-containing protein [Phytohabitans flavus]|uniref:toxin TcdB middle/N-terminal domain-containing protein n=1 Tax=Phytohabitans flavus TaxID=1076124 RepID=UPI001563E3DB|nr:toxin TcdB middle/N-terminal domain-containing protein [Phytohabitans flavus]